jgi:hypothetical protein
VSDVGLNLPQWLVLVVLGVELWPVALILGIGALAAAAFTRGTWRIAASCAAALLVLDVAAAGLIGVVRMRDDANARAFDRSLRSTLDTAQVIDGVNLPAASVVTWTDPTHAHVEYASLPQPTDLLGVTADWLHRTDDGGWTVRLSAPQAIDGWTCQPEFVDLGQDGHLRGCTLAAGREWNRWPIPPATLVKLDGPDKAVGMVLPKDAPMMADEIDRPLPATGLMSMNADGSLRAAYFEADAPLVVCGISLWNSVGWEYAAPTFGRGRDRPVMAVTGALTNDLAYRGRELRSGTTVELRLPDCSLTAR